ncbi:MAG: Eco57I restriction-modification methylase domain-containing protein, partial [Eubacteriales bacterium]
LINQLKEKPEQFRDKISRGSFWNKEVKEMKFDAIVGNPPYQSETGGSGRQATPVYNLFVENGKKLNPNYLSMIMPSRWFSGGFGLDGFREQMLNDESIRIIVDYPNSTDAFASVDISGGVCYILWNKNDKGLCSVINVQGNKRFSSIRKLNEYKTFVRYSQSIPIIRKIFEIEKSKKTLEDVVSPQRPFGLPTNYQPKESGIPCYFIQKIGKRYAKSSDIVDTNNLLNKWKLLVPKAPIAGQTDFTKPIGFYYDGNTRIAEPGSCCTESFIVAGAFDTEEEVYSYKSYLFTKIVRFLLLQTVISQDVLRNKFSFVPALEKYEGKYTDEQLCQLWDITEEEWQYIDSRIHNYEH